MNRILTDDRVKLAFASALIQMTNFLLLLLAKTTISDEDFVFLLTQLATAAIIGAIASLRLEVLMYQAHQGMTRAALLAPIVATAVVIFLTYLGFSVVALVWVKSPILSPLAVPMLLGLALSTVLNFIFVQVQRLNLLLTVRAVQCMVLSVLMTLLVTQSWAPTGGELLFAIGLGYALPAVVSIMRFFAQIPTDKTDFSALNLLDWAMLRRSSLLTLSTGVNSIYANLPLLIAAITQSASFVADFGLIMRAFSAPITLIGQVIGRLFLAAAMRWSIASALVSSGLAHMVSRTMAQSLALYLLFAPMLIGVLYVYREPLNFSELGIVPYLFLAGLGQCLINSVSQVRIPLRDERAFLVFDSLRLLILAIGLSVGANLVPFEVAFGVTSLLLYTSYIPFIFFRIARYSLI